MFWDVFSGFDHVVSKGISILSYNIFRLVSLAYVAHNMVDCIPRYLDIAVGALS